MVSLKNKGDRICKHSDRKFAILFAIPVIAIILVITSAIKCPQAFESKSDPVIQAQKKEQLLKSVKEALRENGKPVGHTIIFPDSRPNSKESSESVCFEARIKDWQQSNPDKKMISILSIDRLLFLEGLPPDSQPKTESISKNETVIFYVSR